MTISSTTNRVSYTGNGVTTAFAFGYKFLVNADLKVYQAGTLKTITTHYTVAGAGDDAGGTVTFLAAPANGEEVVILRDPAITQGLDLVENDPLPAEDVEDEFDKLTMIAQRLDDRLDRAIVLDDTDTSGASLVLPSPGADEVIKWNAAGDGLESATIAEIGALPIPVPISQGGTNATDAATARTNLGLAIGTNVQAYDADTAKTDVANIWTANQTLGSGISIVFEGTTDDGFETSLSAEDPTTDNSQTLPNYSGQVSVQSRGSDVASAATINLTTATGDIVDVTGTTTITAITLADGLERKVRFTGALTLTNGASLILPSAANISTASGDFAIFRGYAAGVVRCISYTKANGQPLVGGGITLGIAVASTSGTSIDFTGMPAGLDRITIMFSGVSTSGTSSMLVQLGDSGGIENTSYTAGSSAIVGTNATLVANSTAGYILQPASVAAGTYSGCINLNRIDGNTWVSNSSITSTSNGLGYFGGGNKTLSAELDRVRITTAGGTDTFDAGSINISYE